MRRKIDVTGPGGETCHELSLSPEAQKIVEIGRNDRAPVQSFTDVIGAVPVLAARLLRLANFAPGLSQRNLTLSQSLSLFGQDYLKSLALALSLFVTQPDPEGDDSGGDPAGITLHQLWNHALGCAVVAGRIADRIHSAAPLKAFTAGFIHDVGRVLFFQHTRERFDRAVKLARDKSMPLAQAELQVMGIDHAEIGEIWCRKTELTATLQTTVRGHHEPFCLTLEGANSEDTKMMAVVQAADVICEAGGIGGGGDAAAMPRDGWSRLGLIEKEWIELLGTIKSELESVAEFFGIPSAVSIERGRPLAGCAEADACDRSKRFVGKETRGRVISFPVRSTTANGDRKKPAVSKLTILVVEDHNSLCDMLGLYLMRYGYHVRMANDGESALEILAKDEIHLILLDLMLPRMDGFAVLRTLRRQKVTLPYIIVVSAGASDKDRKKVLDLGANEYMPKPFHLSRLLERIQMVEKYLL